MQTHGHTPEPRPIHFIYEVLCSDVTACDTRAKQTPANTTPYDEYVTCPKCLAALGYAVPAVEPARMAA